MAAHSTIFACPRSFYSCTYYQDYRDAPFFCCIIRATCFSDTYIVYGRSSPWSNLDRFNIASSYRGSDSSKLRVRWWWHIVLARSSHLSARLIRCSPANRPLGFGVWRQRGRGIEYVRPRGSLVYLLYLFFMCDTLLCIREFTFMHQTIFMW